MKKLLLPILILCGARFLSAQPIDLTQLVHKTHTQRSILLVSFYNDGITRLDSLALFQLANKMDSMAISDDDDGLHWEAELVRAHYHYAHGLTVTKRLDRLQRYADAGGPKWFTTRIENMLGWLCMDLLQDQELGLFHFTQAADMLNDEDGAEYPYKQKFQYDAGTRMCDLSDHANAIVHLRKALETKAPNIHGFDYRLHASNSLGCSYRALGRLDSSDHYFSKALELSQRSGDSIWASIADGNLGENLYLEGGFEAAIPHLRKDVSVAVPMADWGRASNALIFLGDIYLRKGAVKQSRQLLDSASVFAHRTGELRRLAVLYPRMAKLCAVENRPQLAQMFIDSFLIVSNRLIRDANDFRVTRTQQRIGLEKVRVEAEQKELLLSAQLQRDYYIILTLILITAVIILILNQRRLKAKLGQRLADEKRAEAEQDLKNAQQRLNDFLENVQHLQQEISHQSESEFFEPAQQNASELENTVIFTERQWREFTDLFESVHPGFFQRLNEKLPELTAAETRFMALSRMRLGTKEMATMLAISTDAVRQTRSRLNRKLTLDIPLEQFALEV